MSYDIALLDPITKKIIDLNGKHHMAQGTYCVGGTREASLNITYNYGPRFHRWIDEQEGIRKIYGMTGAESMPLLQHAIDGMGDDADPDYWKNTEGNAKKALCNLLALAQMHPEGIWAGD